VSPSLPDEVVSPARAIADEIVSDYWRQRALAALAMLPTAPGYPDALIEPLTLALDLRNQEETAIEIRRLAPYLPDLPAETVHRLWSVALHKLAHDDRYFLLQHLTACAPVIMLLGRDQAVKQSELAASDASRWWGNPRETISQRSEENSPPDEVYSETVIAEDEPPSTRISYHAMVSLATYLTDDGHLDACWRCLITSKEVPWKQAAILMWSQAIHQGRRMQVWPSDWYTPIVKADSLTKPTGPVRKYDNFTSSIRPTTI